jgi:Ca2+-binding EF-hand superfamily protein
MMRCIRTALLVGVGVVLGAGTALAQMAPPPTSPDLYGPGSMRGRLADRASRDFDLNKDGKIAKAELDKALAQRFSGVAGGSAITEAQFEKAHEASLHGQSAGEFHRLDWNGDGVLSLDEFRAPLRARFEKMDRDGSGVVSCAPRAQTGKGGAHGHARSFGGGLAKMCAEADLNKDGKITRGEFDKAAGDRYAAVAKGGKGLTADGFFQLELARFKDMEARLFKRLDTNHDGKLSEGEFAAPGNKLFAKLDKNHDGVVTKDEMASAHRGPHKGPRGSASNGARKTG